MGWDIEGTDQFADWYGSLDASPQGRVEYAIRLLEEYGPLLGRPHADTVSGSKFKNMKELRVQSGGDPLRVFFIFDPRTVGLLLIGGDKTGDGRFYDRMIRRADDLYEQHLAGLENERGR